MLHERKRTLLWLDKLYSILNIINETFLYMYIHVDTWKRYLLMANL
jgi:hypothetical protein